MLKKVCPNCGQASYSASEFGLWICPTCEHNLRYVPTEPAEAIDDITDAGNIHFEEYLVKGNIYENPELLEGN